MRRLQRQFGDAGLRVVRQQLYATGLIRRLPSGLSTWIRESALTQDYVLNNVECVLAPA
jgi:hypothetical protein